MGPVPPPGTDVPILLMVQGFAFQQLKKPSGYCVVSTERLC